jgi:hypothetical protein
MIGAVLRLFGVILEKVPDPDEGIRKSNRLGRMLKSRAILVGKLTTSPDNLKLQARLAWVEGEIARLTRELGVGDGSDSETPRDQE